jgi:hypothetical protein
MQSMVEAVEKLSVDHWAKEQLQAVQAPEAQAVR